jgi:hypothetical protein
MQVVIWRQPRSHQASMAPAAQHAAPCCHRRHAGATRHSTRQQHRSRQQHRPQLLTAALLLACMLAPACRASQQDEQHYDGSPHTGSRFKPLSKPCPPGCEKYGNCNIEEGR